VTHCFSGFVSAACLLLLAAALLIRIQALRVQNGALLAVLVRRIEHETIVVNSSLCARNSSVDVTPTAVAAKARVSQIHAQVTSMVCIGDHNTQQQACVQTL
jgi:hypothetical protein